MPTTPQTVHDLRRQWKPHKVRLATIRDEHPPEIRFHRDGSDNPREYRTILISAAVTGKPDVREEVA